MPETAPLDFRDEQPCGEPTWACGAPPRCPAEDLGGRKEPLHTDSGQLGRQGGLDAVDVKFAGPRPLLALS